MKQRISLADRILVADQDFKVQYFVLMVNQACHFFTLARNKNLAPHFSDISLVPGLQIVSCIVYKSVPLVKKQEHENSDRYAQSLLLI